jgi:hypothetical protein
MAQRKQKMVTVCASCLMASCWQGDFCCQDYMTADITHKSVKELAKLNRENSCYWKTDEELATA